MLEIAKKFVCRAIRIQKNKLNLYEIIIEVSTPGCTVTGRVYLLVDESGMVKQSSFSNEYLLANKYHLDILLFSISRFMCRDSEHLIIVEKVLAHYFGDASCFVDRGMDQLGILLMLTNPKFSRLKEYLNHPLTFFMLADALRKGGDSESLSRKKRPELLQQLLQLKIQRALGAQSNETIPKRITQSVYKQLQSLRLSYHWHTSIKLAKYRENVNFFITEVLQGKLATCRFRSDVLSIKQLKKISRFMKTDKPKSVRLSAIEIVQFMEQSGNPRFFEDIKALSEELNYTGLNQKLKHCRQAKGLFELHKWLLAEIETSHHGSSDIEQALLINEKLPEPLLVGEQDIQALTDFQEVYQEAQDMENCLAYGNYFDDAMSGRIALYRVFKPQRATLEVVQYPELKLEQIKLAENAEPSAKTIEYVNRWFESAQSQNQLTNLSKEMNQ